MTKNKLLVAMGALAISTSAMADLSATGTLVSDYTFNGVSQTDSGPAVQGSFDYSQASGLYAGTWASTLDFGSADDTDLEWDFYVGQYLELNDTVSVDAGIAHYTYHGDDASSDYAYSEAYSKFGFASEFGQTEANLWYAWDYFGTGAGHYIVMAAHSYEVAPGHTLRASFDQSTSLDDDKWNWNGEESYIHYRLAYQTSIEGFDLEVAAEDTDIDSSYGDTADARIVATVSRSFGF
ncbi:MAG: TorF family putative porin [Bermanella sp.]